MKIFNATVLANVEGFAQAVERVHPANNLRVADNVWLIAANGTAQEVCIGLGMPGVPGTVSPFSAVVVGVSGYYGFGGNNIWEWLAAKQAQDA